MSRALKEGIEIEVCAFEVAKRNRGLEPQLRSVIGRVCQMPWDKSSKRLFGGALYIK